MLSIPLNSASRSTPPPPPVLSETQRENVIEPTFTGVHNPQGIALASSIGASQKQPVKSARRARTDDRDKLRKIAMQQSRQYRLWAAHDRISMNLRTLRSLHEFNAVLGAIDRYCSTLSHKSACGLMDNYCCILRDRLLVKTSGSIFRIDEPHRPEALSRYSASIDLSDAQNPKVLFQALSAGHDAYMSILEGMATDGFNCRDIAEMHGIYEPGPIARIEMACVTSHAGKEARKGQNCQHLKKKYDLTNRHALLLLETISLLGPAWHDIQRGVDSQEIARKYGYATKSVMREMTQAARQYDSKTLAGGDKAVQVTDAVSGNGAATHRPGKRYAATPASAVPSRRLKPRQPHVSAE
ncbi:hypothetical protein [Acerihabitans arboris]|uniref:Uncharacterized protein n=1 Tax=Acerihabitans arboris TaxID=2691583 RepID=A0A845SLU7_9GAMM|nr:hypothetical protein [Acerihabitans arboris]NDL63548.1 hypothetical protein [Acerihabitans arboris]